MFKLRFPVRFGHSSVFRTLRSKYVFVPSQVASQAAPRNIRATFCSGLAGFKSSANSRNSGSFEEPCERVKFEEENCASARNCGPSVTWKNRTLSARCNDPGSCCASASSTTLFFSCFPGLQNVQNLSDELSDVPVSRSQ